jgi:hypothetical protein
VEGACVAAALGDAGSAGALADAAVPAIDNVRVDQVADSVSWTEAVAVPAVQTTIEGADDRILGTWLEAGCDSASKSPGSKGCVRVTIARDSSGAVSGTLRYDGPPQLGPFSPASDPDLGYPIEVAPARYMDLQLNGDNGVDYRLLDGSFHDQRLTFGWSVTDLWSSWCQLQVPYLWRVQAHEIYFCVPQDKTQQAAFDEGKVALCRTDTFEDLCTNPNGISVPCVCLPDDRDPRCSQAVCRCDSHGCDADVTQGPIQGAWMLAGDQLTGGSGDFDWLYPLTLVRGNP